jgi:hypothetical protein
MMVPDALENIASRLELRKPENEWNREFASLYLREWWKPVSTRPSFTYPWMEGSKLCTQVDNKVNNHESNGKNRVTL